MRLKVLNAFNDAVADKLRAVGDEFEADAKRAEELLAHHLHLVEKVEDEAEKPVAKPAAKKPAAKKAAKK